MKMRLMIRERQPGFRCRIASSRLGRAAVAAMAVAVGVQCAPAGSLENPVARRLAWYSFLNGDDIRQTCGPGRDDRARLVLNGRYTEQVRVYELTTRGGAPTLDVHVFAPLIVNRAFTVADIQEALRGRPQRVRLGQAGTDALWSALTASGAFEPAPRGLVLDSDALYWIAVGCRDGRVFFNAWQHPSPRFAALTFPDLLRRYDPSEVPFPDLREGPVTEVRSPREEAARPHFQLTVGPGGLQ